jgi:hypothetical protein
MREFTRITKDRIEFLDSRFYQDQKTGLYLPSVTTILDCYPKGYGYYEWLKQVGEDADEIRDEAGRKGSKVHQLTEDYDDGLECCMIDENGNPLFKQIEWAMFERYVEFRDRFKEYELIANEVHYTSPNLGYGGTLDRVFEKMIFPGSVIVSDKKKRKSVVERILLDIKTGNAIYPHYWLQQAAYAKLWNEINPDQPIDQIAILWLKSSTRTEGKTGDIQGKGWKLYFPDQPIEHYWNLFRATFALWKEENKNLVPRNLSYQLKHQINAKVSS